MKRIGFINGLRIVGLVTNISRLTGVKRSNAGAVSLTAAPTTKFTKTGLSLKTAGGTATKYTKILTVGLTNLQGGRNFIYGKIIYKNTGANKNTATVKVKTLAGTQTLLTTAPTAKTKTKTFSNTVEMPIDYPGSLIAIVKPAAGKLTQMKLTGISVNQLTTELF